MFLKLSILSTRNTAPTTYWLFIQQLHCMLLSILSSIRIYLAVLDNSIHDKIRDHVVLCPSFNFSFLKWASDQHVMAEIHWTGHTIYLVGELLWWASSKGIQPTAFVGSPIGLATHLFLCFLILNLWFPPGALFPKYTVWNIYRNLSATISIILLRLSRNL